MEQAKALEKEGCEIDYYGVKGNTQAEADKALDLLSKEVLEIVNLIK